jgi:hypothetical protein
VCGEIGETALNFIFGSLTSFKERQTYYPSSESYTVIKAASTPRMFVI